MQLEGAQPSQRNELDEYGTAWPIISKSLQDFVYLNLAISSLGYVCHLMLPGALASGISCIANASPLWCAASHN
jgi:hypothetical protein